jgi:hypothetical protein
MRGTTTQKLVFGGIGAVLLGIYAYANRHERNKVVPLHKLSYRGRLRRTRMLSTR